MTHVTLKGKATKISGNLPAIGTHAPDFILVDSALKDHSLKDYRGKRKLLSIVPSLDTPVCALSTKKFNERIANRSDIILLVISADLPFAQKRICSEEHLNNVIPLSMMRSKEFAEAYGVLIEEGPLAGICTRALLVIDENDQILYTELVEEITYEPNYEKALEVLLS